MLVPIFWSYTGLLMIATHIPGSTLPPVDFLWFDKLQHFTAYGLWTTLLLLSGLLGSGSYLKRASRALGWSFLLAVFDELLQMIPILNRFADPLDVAADVLGSVCAVCVVWVWERRRKSHTGDG